MTTETKTAYATALEDVRAIVNDKLSLDEIFRIYDVMNKLSMAEYNDGKMDALKTYAPTVYYILTKES